MQNTFQKKKNDASHPHLEWDKHSHKMVTVLNFNSMKTEKRIFKKKKRFEQTLNRNLCMQRINQIKKTSEAGHRPALLSRENKI